MSIIERLGYSISEVAKLLGVSRPTVYTLMRENNLPLIRAGRRVIIPAEQFKDWIAQRAERSNEHGKSAFFED